MKKINFSLIILVTMLIVLAGKCSNKTPQPITTNPSSQSSPANEAVIQIPLTDEFYSTSSYTNLPPQCKFSLSKPFTMITSILTHDSQGNEVPVWGNVTTNTDFYNASDPSVAMMVPRDGDFFIRSLIIFDGCTECCGFNLLNNAGTPLTGCLETNNNNNWIEQGKLTMELESKIYLKSTGGAGQVFTLDFTEVLCDCNCM